MRFLPFDKNRILGKFETAKRYLQKSKEIQDYELKRFLSDFDLQLKGERVLEVLSQIMLDVCTHIVANSDSETPLTYSDCMKILARLQIISENSAEKYARLIKMRNLIAHQYSRVDNQLLYEGLKQLQVDFIQFQKAILLWLKSI